MTTFKIIISPSKTQHLKQPENIKVLKATKPSGILQKHTQVLLHRLKDLDKEALGEKLRVKGKLLEETYHLYKDYEKQAVNKTICLYTGSVFKGLELSAYSEETLAYLGERVRILSAFYGILKPFDEVKPYRLDMTGRIFEEGSYAYWKEPINEILKKENIIINLASDEFSQLVTHPMITISFKEHDENGKLVVKSTYAKIARGKMINAIVLEKITDVSQIKDIEVDRYCFSSDLSSDLCWVFVR